MSTPLKPDPGTIHQAQATKNGEIIPPAANQAPAGNVTGMTATGTPCDPSDPRCVMVEIQETLPDGTLHRTIMRRSNQEAR